MAESRVVAETRKVAAILVADIVGYSRLIEADEEGTLARLRALRSDFIDPTIAIHNGRVVKRLGDGAITEFRSVVEAVRCAKEVLHGLAERNACLPDDQRIEVRTGIHLGDVVEEADGDLMGDGVNIAARLEGICQPGAICLSEDAYRQVRDKIKETFVDLGEQDLKNIAYPVRVYALTPRTGGRPASRSATVVARSPSLSGVTPTVDKRSRRRRRLPFLFLFVAAIFLFGAATFAILGTLAWRGQAPFAPPSPAPPPAGALEALERLQQLRSYSPPPSPAGAVDDRLARAPRLSIVVLPFANLSGDPEQDSFADGLTDNLTTDFSHMPGSFIIAHNTASAYKGKTINQKQLGRELGVRYTLEGSVRRIGHTIVVDAQLISTESGVQVWGDRFEGERNRRDELQGELVSRIADAISRALIPR